MLALQLSGCTTTKWGVGDYSYETSPDGVEYCRENGHRCVAFPRNGSGYKWTVGKDSYERTRNKVEHCRGYVCVAYPVR